MGSEDCGKTQSVGKTLSRVLKGLTINKQLLQNTVERICYLLDLSNPLFAFRTLQISTKEGKFFIEATTISIQVFASLDIVENSDNNIFQTPVRIEGGKLNTILSHTAGETCVFSMSRTSLNLQINENIFVLDTLTSLGYKHTEFPVMSAMCKFDPVRWIAELKKATSCLLVDDENKVKDRVRCTPEAIISTNGQILTYNEAVEVIPPRPFHLLKSSVQKLIRAIDKSVCGYYAFADNSCFVIIDNLHISLQEAITVRMYNHNVIRNYPVLVESKLSKQLLHNELSMLLALGDLYSLVSLTAQGGKLKLSSKHNNCAAETFIPLLVDVPSECVIKCSIKACLHMLGNFSEDMVSFSILDGGSSKKVLKLYENTYECFLIGAVDG